jgi:rhodanese-related sulfurtransferase
MKSFFSESLGGLFVIVAATVIGITVNGMRPNGLALIPPGAPVSTVQHGDSLAAADTARTDTTLAEGAISLQEVKRRFDAGTGFIVDARSPEEYEQGHIPGAINIPHDRIPEFLDALNSQVPTDGEVTIYCRGPSCDFSDLLATEMKMLGYKNVSVFSGGWEQWTLAGYPTEGLMPK